MTLAERYAAFAGKLSWADLPTEVRQTSLELFLDWFANAVAGFDSPLCRALRALAPESEAPVRAVRAGDLKAVEPLWAVLINASAAHALEYDDSYRPGLYHPGAPIVSAVFAASCQKKASGLALLTAMVAGYEISLRIATAVGPSHYRHWHTTGTVGSFGAAVGAAKALGLEPGQVTAALGLSGTQAAGLWEVLPEAPRVKNLHPAKAAHAGLLSALLAGQGIQGPTTIFEGTRGFFAAAVPDAVDGDRCVRGLGTDWLMLDTTFKAYPVCGHTMTPIEASLSLFGRFDLADVKAIEVRAHPASLQVAGQRFPRDADQAKFSIPYCVAVALMRGKVGLGEFSGELVRSKAIQSVLEKIHLIADDTLSHLPDRRPAKLTVRLTGDREITAAAEVRKGDPELPMTAAEKRSKVMALIGQGMRIKEANALDERLSGLPGATDVLAWAEGLREVLEPIRTAK